VSIEDLNVKIGNFNKRACFGTTFWLKSPLVSFAAVIRVVMQCFSPKRCVMTLTTAAIQTKSPLACILSDQLSYLDVRLLKKLIETPG